MFTQDIRLLWINNQAFHPHDACPHRHNACCVLLCCAPPCCAALCWAACECNSQVQVQRQLAHLTGSCCVCTFTICCKSLAHNAPECRCALQALAAQADPWTASASPGSTTSWGQASAFQAGLSQTGLQGGSATLPFLTGLSPLAIGKSVLRSLQH